MTSDRLSQPLCDDCWVRDKGRDAAPNRIGLREYQTCCDCGRVTTSGIYVTRQRDEINHLTDWDAEPEGTTDD